MTFKLSDFARQALLQDFKKCLQQCIREIINASSNMYPLIGNDVHKIEAVASAGFKVFP